MRDAPSTADGIPSPPTTRHADTYTIARRAFLALLGVVYFTAFASLGAQIIGLVGHRGILPADRFLAGVQAALGGAGWLRVPTVFWFGVSDAALRAVCFTGAGLSVLLILGILPAVVLPLLWIGYLSLTNVGGDFLGFQWDALLLEAGFLAILLAPRGLRPLARAPAPPRFVVFLFHWLLFRLMFGSGTAKLLSGDPTWRGLHAMEFHYETQPLPTPVGWYAHHLPPWFQMASTALTLVIELVVPFFYFAPRRPRHAAGIATIGFQGLIALTGNFAFFNWLTIAITLMLFDDRAWRRGARVALQWPRPARVPWFALHACAGVLFALSLLHWAGSVIGWRAMPAGARGVMGAIAPYEVVNGYGLFAVMTTTRPEIVIEGSADGQAWKEYAFRWKPGALDREPGWIAPYQPRLDWQLWFAALGRYDSTPWFAAFVGRLLEGSPEVLALLATNPFPDHPPRYIRARLYDYRFTDLATRRRTHRWWSREERGVYSPVLSLQPGGG